MMKFETILLKTLSRLNKKEINLEKAFEILMAAYAEEYDQWESDYLKLNGK